MILAGSAPVGSFSGQTKIAPRGSKLEADLVSALWLKKRDIFKKVSGGK